MIETMTPTRFLIVCVALAAVIASAAGAVYAVEPVGRVSPDGPAVACRVGGHIVTVGCLP